MPALPDVPNVIKFVIEGTLDGVNWANIFHWLYSGSAPSNAELGTILSQFATEFGNGGGVLNWDSLAHDQVFLSNSTAEDLTTHSSATAELPLSVNGTLSGGKLPASAAVVMTHSINRRYRGGHPRSYLMLGDTTKLQDSTFWATAFLDSVISWYNGFVAGINGISAGGTTLTSPVSVSYFSGHALRSVPVIDPITSSFPRQRVCSQRRRLGKNLGI